MLSRQLNYLRGVTLQGYVNALLAFIGLLANVVALGQFVGAFTTPPTGSNFYVNSREYLAWALLAVVYSLASINALIRRRWRGRYGRGFVGHSVFNLFLALQNDISEDEAKLRLNNFQRDFSFMYVELFFFTFLFSRAIVATEYATSLTPSPWGDILLSAFINIFVALGMMVFTSMFDYAFSMFVGEPARDKQV